MTLRLVLATANPHKVEEIRSILEASGLAVDLVARPADVPDVVEDAPDLEGNARLKARALVAATGLPAVADDTGLEVDALGGEPGVRSARYAGPEGDSVANVAKLLAALEAVAARGVHAEAGPAGAAAADRTSRNDRPDRAVRAARNDRTVRTDRTAPTDRPDWPDRTARTARFRTVALVAWPDGGEQVAEGIVSGVIAAAPRGETGFGYDPVFVPDDGDGRTFAEMTSAEKDAISHRGRAFRSLATLLPPR